MTPAEVLLVEDSEDERAVARRAFRRYGVGEQVAEARDGVEALDYLRAARRRDALPRLVLLDLDLPRLDGFDVLRELRSDDVLRELPVVVVSSSARGADVRRSYRLGANSYVVKRSEASRPGHYLAEAARYWLDLNVVPSE